MVFLTILSFQPKGFGSAIEPYVSYHLQHHPEAALNYLKTLEKMDHPEGVFLLGCLYLQGGVVTPDIPKANFYFYKAGHLGYAPAFKALADSYLAGDGVKKDPMMALYYYERSAIRGYGPGQFNAGALLKEGQNVTSNQTQAFYWLNQAAHNPDLGDLRKDAANLRNEIKVNDPIKLQKGVRR